MKTAMQELLSEMSHPNWDRLSFDARYEMFDILLEKEKEQMIDFAYECTQHISREDIEQYYNKKVNQKQHIIDIMKSDEEGGLYKQEKEEALSFLVKQAQELDLGYEEFELGGEG